MNEALYYKLCMMGIPIDVMKNIFCDNDSVIKNATDLALTLSKKHIAIAYHKVREAVAAGIQCIDVADLLTMNLLPHQLKDCCRCVLF